MWSCSSYKNPRYRSAELTSMLRSICSCSDAQNSSAFVTATDLRCCPANFPRSHHGSWAPLAFPSTTWIANPTIRLVHFPRSDEALRLSCLFCLPGVTCDLASIGYLSRHSIARGMADANPQQQFFRYFQHEATGKGPQESQGSRSLSDAPSRSPAAVRAVGNRRSFARASRCHRPLSGGDSTAIARGDGCLVVPPRLRPADVLGSHQRAVVEARRNTVAGSTEDQIRLQDEEERVRDLAPRCGRDGGETEQRPPGISRHAELLFQRVLRRAHTGDPADPAKRG